MMQVSPPRLDPGYVTDYKHYKHTLLTLINNGVKENWTPLAAAAALKWDFSATNSVTSTSSLYPKWGMALDRTMALTIALWIPLMGSVRSWPTTARTGILGGAGVGVKGGTTGVVVGLAVGDGWKACGGGGSSSSATRGMCNREEKKERNIILTMGVILLLALESNILK